MLDIVKLSEDLKTKLLVSFPEMTDEQFRAMLMDGAVLIDEFQAAYDMTRHIIGLGHERIGFIIGNPEQVASGQRLEREIALFETEMRRDHHVMGRTLRNAIERSSIQPLQQHRLPCRRRAASSLSPTAPR